MILKIIKKNFSRDFFYKKKIQLENINSNLEIKEIRGNVGTRIKKVKNGSFDSIILAHAGLKKIKNKK